MRRFYQLSKTRWHSLLILSTIVAAVPGCGKKGPANGQAPVLPKIATETLRLSCDSITLHGQYLAPSDWRLSSDTLFLLSPANKDSILYAFANDPLERIASGSAIGGGTTEYRNPFLAGVGRNDPTLWVGDKQIGHLDQWRIDGSSFVLENRYRIGGLKTPYDIIYGVEILNDSVCLIKYDSGSELTLDIFDFTKNSVVRHHPMALRPELSDGVYMFYDFALASRNDRIAWAYLFMDRIESHRFALSGLQPEWTIDGGTHRPDKQVTNGRIDELKICYTDLKCTDSLIYALYQGCKTDEVRRVHSTVEVYDHSGKAQGHWNLGRPIRKIAIDETWRILYALGSNSDVIYRYRMPELHASEN